MDNFFSYNNSLQSAMSDNNSLYEKQQNSLQHFKEKQQTITEPLDLLGAELLKDATLKGIGGALKKEVVKQGKQALQKAGGKAVQQIGKATGSDILQKAGDNLATKGLDGAIQGAKNDLQTEGGKLLDNATVQAKNKVGDILGADSKDLSGSGKGILGDIQDKIRSQAQSKGEALVSQAKSKVLQGKDLSTGKALDLDDIGQGYLTKGGKGKASVAKKVKNLVNDAGEDQPLTYAEQLTKTADEKYADFLSGDIKPLNIGAKSRLPKVLTQAQQDLQAGKLVEVDPFKSTPQAPSPPKKSQLENESEGDFSQEALENEDLIGGFDKSAKEAKRIANLGKQEIKQVPKSGGTDFKYKAPTKKLFEESEGGVQADSPPTLTKDTAQALKSTFDPTAPVEGEFTGTGGAYKGKGGQVIKQGDEPEKLTKEPISEPTETGKFKGDPLFVDTEDEEEDEPVKPAQEEEEFDGFGKEEDDKPPPVQEEEEFEGFGKAYEDDQALQAQRARTAIAQQKAIGEPSFTQADIDAESVARRARIQALTDTTQTNLKPATNDPLLNPSKDMLQKQQPFKGDSDASLNTKGIDQAPSPANKPPPPKGQKYNEAGDLIEDTEAGGAEDDLVKATAGSLVEDADPINILVTAGLGLATLLSPLFMSKPHENPINAVNPSAQFGSN